MSSNQTSLGEALRTDGGVLQTGPFGSQLKQSEYSAEGIPVIMPKDIRDGCVMLDTVARVPEATAERLSRHKIAKNGIVLPRRGEITKRAFISEEQAGWLCGTGCLKIEAQGKFIWPKFLYYYLGAPKSVEWLERNAVGSTMLNLSAEIVARFPLRLPSLSQQKDAARILSGYDDLIDNNRRRIALLEEAARLLYREWFVHLRFPGHEHINVVDGVPIGWERLPLGKILTLKRGYDLPEASRVRGEVPVVSSAGITGTHTQAKAAAPGVVTGRYGTLGEVYYIEDAFWPLNTALYIVDFKGLQPLMAFHLLKALLAGITTEKAAVPGLDRNVLHAMTVIWPPRNLQDAFVDVVRDYQRQIRVLGEMVEKLAQARDLLLPRLMNGETAV